MLTSKIMLGNGKLAHWITEILLNYLETLGGLLC